MLCSIVGNLKIVSLPKFELIWTMGSVSRMLLISPNFSLALWPRTNRSSKKPHFPKDGSLHLEMWSIMCNGADENQAHRCDPYGLRVQEQPLFLVCSSITIFTSVGLGP